MTAFLKWFDFDETKLEFLLIVRFNESCMYICI